jgi:hypothetical protein
MFPCYDMKYHFKKLSKQVLSGILRRSEEKQLLLLLIAIIACQVGKYRYLNNNMNLSLIRLFCHQLLIFRIRNDEKDICCTFPFSFQVLLS